MRLIFAKLLIIMLICHYSKILSDEQPLPTQTSDNLSFNRIQNRFWTKKIVECSPKPDKPAVTLITLADFIKLLIAENLLVHGTTPKVSESCMLVMFYRETFAVSNEALSLFSTLSKDFPDLKVVAINIEDYRHIKVHPNSNYGETQNFMLFYKGRFLGVYTESDYSLESFSKFIKKCSEIKSSGKLSVISNIFAGPVKIRRPAPHNHIYLILSWLLIVLIIISYSYYTRCRTWKRMAEMIAQEQRRRQLV